ncbi:NADH-quinone oxidoreductase subunit C [Streptomyces sp. CRN 30]|uniref:NADH-quinone oxidoreductase subunit C n=1 Tax=Streptomyces sp. CRN 30 TaxID=3075613 RepID=UPI002A7EB4CB|nr:NADH-quinone oxidoreductase subunit C [Streptomyces sp. CRN 30]
MTGWLPAPVEELFGPDATAEESYGVLTVDVPSAGWTEALRTAHARLGCTYFDWLSAVDEPGTGFRVSAHVVVLSPVRRLLLRTTVPHENPVLPSAVDVYAGAAWHERETHEMFGVTFQGHPGLDPLLLPENFEGHPLRKDFVLAARVAKAWPGAKEPGESDSGGPKRRQMLPPGVPDPNEWGPLKGQLPPAPARGARTARTAGAAGDRPVRRTRTAAEGSAGQTGPTTDTAPTRRTRTASGGSASQRAGDAGAPEAAVPSEPTQPSPGPRRTRTASGGSASQRAESAGSPGSGPSAEPAPPAGPRRTRSASGGSASQRAASGPREPSPRTEHSGPQASTAPRSADAPWHHARPAFDEPQAEPQPTEGTGLEPTPQTPQTQPQQPATSPVPDPSPDPSEPSDQPNPSDQPGPPDPSDPSDSDPSAPAFPDPARSDPDTPAGGAQ